LLYTPPTTAKVKPAERALGENGGLACTRQTGWSELCSGRFEAGRFSKPTAGCTLRTLLRQFLLLRKLCNQRLLPRRCAGALGAFRGRLRGKGGGLGAGCFCSLLKVLQQLYSRTNGTRKEPHQNHSFAAYVGQSWTAQTAVSRRAMAQVQSPHNLACLHGR